MREREFYNWLVKSGLQPNTANSRLKNCIRVCQYEGDLDVLYDRDQCQNLLFRLTYSGYDAMNRRAPRHTIPINGDVYNGTSTLKSAVKKYVEFCKSSKTYYNPPIMKTLEANSYHTARSNYHLNNAELLNKDFAYSIADIIMRFSDKVMADDIRNLTDADFCRRFFNCKYPVLVKVPADEFDIRKYTHIWSHRRFYSDVTIIYGGQKYLVSNDWYHSNENSNRNKFKDWLIRKIGL